MLLWIYMHTHMCYFFFFLRFTTVLLITNSLILLKNKYTNLLYQNINLVHYEIKKKVKLDKIK